MITAMFLRDALDLQSALAPFRRDNFAAAVGGGFFEAGGLRKHKAAKGAEHLWEGGLQQAMDLRCARGNGHCVDMLTMARRMSNAEREQVSRGWCGCQDHVRKQGLRASIEERFFDCAARPHERTRTKRPCRSARNDTPGRTAEKIAQSGEETRLARMDRTADSAPAKRAAGAE